MICSGVGRKPRLDEKVARLHLPVHGATLTVLTQEHIDYLGVKVEGTFKGEHHSSFVSRKNV